MTARKKPPLPATQDDIKFFEGVYWSLIERVGELERSVEELTRRYDFVAYPWDSGSMRAEGKCHDTKTTSGANANVVSDNS